MSISPKRQLYQYLSLSLQSNLKHGWFTRKFAKEAESSYEPGGSDGSRTFARTSYVSDWSVGRGADCIWRTFRIFFFCFFCFGGGEREEESEAKRGLTFFGNRGGGVARRGGGVVHNGGRRVCGERLNIFCSGPKCPPRLHLGTMNSDAPNALSARVQ